MAPIALRLLKVQMKPDCSGYDQFLKNRPLLSGIKKGLLFGTKKLYHWLTKKTSSG
jgi:hypothetical protein